MAQIYTLCENAFRPNYHVPEGFARAVGNSYGLPLNFRSTSLLRMQIQVHTVSGRKHTIDVEGNWTVSAIKEGLQQLEGIPVQQQRMLYHGQNLTDQTTIEVARVQACEVLHMIIALPAG
jgi:hypothetical protein